MTRHLTVGERVRPATRHLIHRPRSALHTVPDRDDTSAERFTLAGDMPYDHPLFNDGLGQVHDSLLFVEIVRHVGAFIGRRYFRVPLDRRCRFDSVEFALSTPAAWRVSKSPAHMAVDLHASPAPLIGRIPGGLSLRGTMEVDGVAGCTGQASLRFLAPSGLHRATRVLRAAVLGGRYGQPSVDPHEVGRCDPRNVVVSAPTHTDDALRTDLLVDAGHPVFFAEHSEFVPGILLVEAIRQTSLLAVQRTHGFDARRTHVTRASVRFPADATLDLPSTCTAQTVPHDGDLDEGPTTRIRTEVRQLDRVVAEAELMLTHTG